MKKIFEWCRTIWILLRNYERTDQVFKLYDLTPKFMQRRIIRKLKKHENGVRLLNGEFRDIIEKIYDKGFLSSFPEGSLGNELLKLPYVPLTQYQKNQSNLATAFTALHDPLHILTGYSTTAEDEACLQAFSWHHLQVPAPLIIAFGYALSNPKSFSKVYRAYKWGKKVPWLLLVDFDKYLDKPVEVVKRELSI
jgi:ubiquinone biosynthesis protein Coq4